MRRTITSLIDTISTSTFYNAESKPFLEALHASVKAILHKHTPMLSSEEKLKPIDQKLFNEVKIIIKNTIGGNSTAEKLTHETLQSCSDIKGFYRKKQIAATLIIQDKIKEINSLSS